MADISKVRMLNGTEYNYKDAQARRDIDDLKADLGDLDERVEALEEGGSGGDGLPDAAKTALLALLSKVAYTNGDGQTYYDDLYDALYPETPPVVVDLLSISAVFTQSEPVNIGTDINGLKDALVVTAYYSDNTTRTVTNYTLSGSLNVGTNTITVTYLGKTTTFNVIVSQRNLPVGYTEKGYIYRTVGENSWTDGLSKLIKTDTVENVSDLTFEFAVMPLAATASSAIIIGAGTFLAGAQTYLRGAVFFADTSRNRISCYSHASAMGTNNISTLAVGEKTDVKLVPGTASPAKLYINGELSTSANWTTTASYSAPISLHTYIGERNVGATKTKAAPNLAVGVISLYDSDETLVAEYVPCVRDSDSVIGLYDTVGAEFYTAETVSYATIGDSDCVYAVGNWGE